MTWRVRLISSVQEEGGEEDGEVEGGEEVFEEGLGGGDGCG